MMSHKPKYPSSLLYIVSNEFAERFSFYGMRSILVTFLIAQFFNPLGTAALQTTAEAKANEVTHFFVSLAYALPFVGALMADWFFGKYKVILYVSLVYCLGHLLLVFFENDYSGFQVGIFLIAIGAGGIKSSVSANLGDQFDDSNRHLLSKGYSLFYFAINVGSVLSAIIIPILYAKYGAQWAFGVPGILMGLATIIFFLGRNKYVNVPPSGINRNNFVFISIYALFHLQKKQKGQSILDIAKEKFDPQKVDDIKTVYNVLAVFAFIPVFWALWDQSLSEWVLQATKLDRRIWGMNLLPEHVQPFNSAFLLLWIPIFSYLIFPSLQKLGVRVTPLRKIGTGLILLAASFVIIAVLQESIDAGSRPSVWWQILAYAVLAAAEVLVSVTGLEYAYTQASKSMKSTLIALWLLTTSLGNLFTALVNRAIVSDSYWASKLNGANYYWFFIGLLCLFIVAYMLVTPFLKERPADVSAQ
jgi:POT family proton-dependent oligopeptide transporter